MNSLLESAFGHRAPSAPWNDKSPVREELFGIERLEQHAQSLAAAQSVTAHPPRGLLLRSRFNDNAAVLLAAYRSSSADFRSGAGVVPAAEWLLDNYHLVEENIRDVRSDLPPGYYRRLPKLASGPFAGYPRVFGLAWAFVAHTDSHVDTEVLRRFIAAYQKVQPLTIGELWAVAITLRIVLIENLRRLADQISAGKEARAEADALAGRLLAQGSAWSALDPDIAALSAEPLSERFAAQLAKRLRDHDPLTTPGLAWLEARLAAQGTSAEEAVQHAQQRQGASNVTVRNVITSLRMIADIDWPELFESVSLVDAHLRDGSPFGSMDFATRNQYRGAIEQMAEGSDCTELEIADHALRAAHAAAADAQEQRMGDPGYHLIAEGRLALEKSIGYRPPPRLAISRLSLRLGIAGYAGAILLLSALLLGAALWMIHASSFAPALVAVLALAGLIPASELAATLVNRAVTWLFGPMALPGLELAEGVPPALRTLVAVPTLLTSEADLLEQIERLEIHHLAGAGGELTFALLSDGLDADQETLPGDAALLAVAARAINELNLRHGTGPQGARFLLLHRRRLFNPGEGKWMGWERKRGKLHELNRLLRGATDTTFIALPDCASQVPAGVRYVVSLDADTRLPRDTVVRLIGKMAHPLNQPRFSQAAQRVVGGHAILQPRVTPSLPVGREGSLYQRVSSGPGGMDPYASASSDVYQDLFGEGSYTGKGIYEVDAFEAALAGRVPENTMLSHDLFEGVFARAGLASDIELVDEFPSRYDVVAKRAHRWTRGDWQLLPWIFGPRGGPRAVSAVGLWKMLDNLRRSLLAPATFTALAASWFLPLHAALQATLLILAAGAIPMLLPGLFILAPRRTDTRLRSHIRMLAADLRLALLAIVFSLMFLADQAWRMIDAISRTLLRVLVTHKHLLEWTTAAQSKGAPRPGLRGYYEQMAGGTLLALITALGAAVFAPASWPLFLPLALLWLAAPDLALRASRPPALGGGLAFSPAEALQLRLIARQTWRYFETFVTPADNMLPPDNFQETPKPALAHRTSPTNIGLYLLSAVAARDFGWAGTADSIERLEAAFAAMRQLQRYRGHFFNWYATQDLRTLPPAYISSVDSGNLAGHLIVLANACEEWIAAPLTGKARLGVTDNLQLAWQALHALPAVEAAHRVTALLDEISARLNSGQALEALAPALKRLGEKTAKAAAELAPGTGPEVADLVYWIQAMVDSLASYERDREQFAGLGEQWEKRLRALAAEARATALEMDFAFLLDPERKLLSIGFSMPDNKLDPSCYDLLASEARLASLFAIAKGDVPTKHWFRLGRAATPVGNGSALISWSGSMFEYLMPSLVMRAPIGSLLEQTNRLVVGRQEAYGDAQGVPWGISESAYNARDMEFTYQYSNFGVPGLGLKRGLADNLVIAPYATGLATMVYPQNALRNFKRLAKMGAAGRYGFYEALDFTRSRLQEDEQFTIVRSYMAHHQGMTIVALANTLQHGRMRSRFHREPMIQACELLLQERLPREVAVARPRAAGMEAPQTELRAAAPSLRRVSGAAGGAPVTHLLSNGRYAVMLTATGAGYSRWRDIAITRWREDATRDNWGAFMFLRDLGGDDKRATGPAAWTEAVFSEDHATFSRRDGSLSTTMEVLVSGEDDGEVRRVSLTNSGRLARKIELTSYAELVLTTAATDNAHPVFAKMFVQTEHVREFGALVATRRPRTPDEPPVWAAHIVVVEGATAAEPQYETDRARFTGRGRNIGSAAAMREGERLSGTVGTVLDPVFSLRQEVTVAPGQVVRVAFWTLVAASRPVLLDLIDKHHDRSAFNRAKTLAWTQAQVELRHIGIDAEEAADFQRLAAPILYADARFRAPAEALVRGAGAQSGLWQHSISGDLPIVLLRIDDIEDIAQVRQLLRAHEYWRMKSLAVDLVIVNERASSYIQDLQIVIETAVRSSQAQPRFGYELAQGTIYALRADLMSIESRTLLQSVARVALVARRGPIAQQLLRLAPAAVAPAPASRREPSRPASPPAAVPTGLEFFNGTGGFGDDGREYVTVLDSGRTTPAPWINVIANPQFGFQCSAEGSGYTWAENSRDNQMTPWSNDPVCDPAGEALYVRDETTGELWTATALPIRESGQYIARHGHGYSLFERQAHDIALELLQYVPLDEPVKISHLRLRNLSPGPRKLSVTGYAEWVLGTSRGAAAPFIITAVDEATGALLARNPWNTAFPGRVAFADLGGRQSALTADRTEFLGRNGAPSAPAALFGSARLSGTAGAGLDPCAALQTVLELEAGESVEVVFILGHCASAEQARALVTRYRSIDLDTVLETVTAHWRRVLGAVQVKTPDRAMDLMLNGWLLYQTLACRVWARSAFYQASGAYGFRDQLQDGMALTFAQPQETRRHLLRSAARQFVEGDVQHWWLPHSGQGVRTRISDDRVWLAFAAATYVICSGDAAILDENVPFLEGPPLHEGEADAFFQPMIADASASMYEHCARGIDQCIELHGEHGLPLMGSGDWNDGMNRVGAGGHGESVWLGWLLLRAIELFAPLAQAREGERAARWRAHAQTLRENLERDAWDGEWYRRATFDDGSWLGSKANDECRIDSIAQSWAVLSGAADPARAATAMASLQSQLIRPQDGVALLFTPPFDKTARDPGYIKGYPPGLRENGGQYSHAAMWSIFAFAKLGAGDQAADLFSLLNPVNHARTREDAERYKVEPYVVAADVYSVAPHIGRGGWTWYTGSAGWMYRAGVEGILGIRREGAMLIIDPCIPSGWPGFSATVKVEATSYEIRVEAPSSNCRGVSRATVDGAPVDCAAGWASVPLDGGIHELVISI
ncbi:MAG: glycosyl transferase [Betaproteobacteria bacterium]|nr:glycosyl transferase [Betaproteobacteria bacterium]